MRIRVAVPDEHVNPDVIDPVLEAVTRVNEHLIASGQSPTATELVKLGAIWRPENMGDEHFDHGSTIAERGWGDCDDWAPLKAAELRATGEDPDAVARVVPSGPNTYHAIVHSHGRDLLGPEDISVQAGMKGRMAEHPSVHGISGVCDGIDVWACDPHDGRIYQGQLAPSVGPLSIRCGPGMAVRGCTIHGPSGPVHLFEARVDMPIQGSRLVHVRSYHRHKPRHVHGAMVPCALSITHMAPTPHDAINGALVGAILAHQSDTPVDIDRYKLMALQGAMSGMNAGDVRARLAQAIHEDLHEAAAQTGHPPESHLHNLRQQAGLIRTAHVVGLDPPQHRRRPWRDEDIDRRHYVVGYVIGGNDRLGTNQGLRPGQGITSPNGRVSFTLQGDGNAVLKDNQTGQVLWTSGTANRGAVIMWMNPDGDLRIEAQGGESHSLWRTGHGPHKDAFLRVQDDGQLFVWDGSNHQIWDAGASLGHPNPTPGGSGHSHTDFGGLDSTIHQVEDVATSIVSDVSKVVNMVPWGEILHDVQAVVSVIPGLGTAISEVLAAAESAIDFLKDGPLIGGLKAAYNFAMGAVPGAAAIRPILDPVVNTLIGLATSKQPVESQILDTLLANVPDSPGFGPITPRSVVSTLAHFLISHLGVKKTAGYVPKSKPSTAAPAHPALLAPPKPKPVPPIVSPHPAVKPPPAPPKVVPLRPVAKPAGVAHAAMAIHPSIPPHPTAAPAPSLATQPGAAKTTWHCAPLPNGHWACAWQ